MRKNRGLIAFVLLLIVALAMVGCVGDAGGPEEITEKPAEKNENEGSKCEYGGNDYRDVGFKLPFQRFRVESSKSHPECRAEWYQEENCSQYAGEESSHGVRFVFVNVPRGEHHIHYSISLVIDEEE